jgi:hypothetical protein
MPASRITYTDEDGNRKVYIGDPRHFKKVKKSKKPEEKTPKYKGGGMAGMRRFNRGGKV